VALAPFDVLTVHVSTPAPRGELDSPKVLGALLLEDGAIDPEGLARALTVQRETGERLGETAVRLGLIAEEAVVSALSRQLGLPRADRPLHPDPAAVRLIRGTFARQRGVVPLGLEGRVLRVASADPLNLETVDDLQFQSGRRVQIVLATREAIQEGLRSAYEGEVSALARELPALPTSPAESAFREESQAVIAAPLVRLVDLLLRRAIEGGASDLHVEQGPDEVIVRERVDGILRRVTELPAAARSSLLARVKIMAGMDISIKRRPQDGGFAFAAGKGTLSVRVSTLPVEGGEKAVLRFLDPRAAPKNLGELGFAARDLRRIRRLIRSGQGVVLATGPTGSGKSSTLFGALGELDRDRLNVVTLEDPIEYRLRGVSQVQVNPRSGLSFPSALRSILRQDPDVVMVGEIRDRETAEIAMSAAITGHLVLSTLHTIDAPSGIDRLVQMGVPAHLIAGGLSGIIRRRCAKCASAPGGCSSCHDGYRGRTGVFQVLTMSDPLREAVHQGAAAVEIRRRAEEDGMGTMSDDALRKVKRQLTTLDEVERVLGGDPGGALRCGRCGVSGAVTGIGCFQCGWPRHGVCPCGRVLLSHWRFCPQCLRKAPPTAGEAG
jgi:type IV pilus assembly protein PilB